MTRPAARDQRHLLAGNLGRVHTAYNLLDTKLIREFCNGYALLRESLYIYLLCPLSSEGLDLHSIVLVCFLGQAAYIKMNVSISMMTNGCSKN